MSYPFQGTAIEPAYHILMSQHVTENIEQEYEYVEWLSREEIASIPYSQFWTDEQRAEENNVASAAILSGDFGKMVEHLEKHGFIKHLKKAVSVIEDKYGIRVGGTCLDLGSGFCWTVPFLLKLSDGIEKIYCIEYSKHRLKVLCQKVLTHFKIPTSRVTLILGNFNDIKFPDNSVDVCLLAAALHHADDPYQLLKEIKRVLKSYGVVIILGEPIKDVFMRYTKHLVKYFVSNFPVRLQEKLFKRSFTVNKLIVPVSYLFSEDEVMGDHDYSHSEYLRMFSDTGFASVRVKDLSDHFQSFILFNKA